MKPSGGLFMKILAIDFSSGERSVAVWNDGVESEVLETNPQTANALGMMDAALGGAKLEREEIEVVVVGLGPGSYTGIRASIALAQGWQLARGVKLLGISSAQAIAVQAQASGMREARAVVSRCGLRFHLHAPEWIRTTGLILRRDALYPAELRARCQTGSE